MSRAFVFALSVPLAVASWYLAFKLACFQLVLLLPSPHCLSARAHGLSACVMLFRHYAIALRTFFHCPSKKPGHKFSVDIGRLTFGCCSLGWCLSAIQESRFNFNIDSDQQLDQHHLHQRSMNAFNRKSKSKLKTTAKTKTKVKTKTKIKYKTLIAFCVFLCHLSPPPHNSPPRTCCCFW